MRAQCLVTELKDTLRRQVIKTIEDGRPDRAISTFAALAEMTAECGIAMFGAHKTVELLKELTRDIEEQGSQLEVEEGHA